MYCLFHDWHVAKLYHTTIKLISTHYLCIPFVRENNDQLHYTFMDGRHCGELACRQAGGMCSFRPYRYTVYPKKYAHGFCFAVFCCGYTLTDFPISIRLTSLALWQSNDCPSASKATLMNLDKYFMWIHYERLHNHNKAKHNKTVCIFRGINCITWRPVSNTQHMGERYHNNTELGITNTLKADISWIVHIVCYLTDSFPDSKVHGANMGPIWGRQDPGGPMLAPWILLSGFIRSKTC